MQIHMSEWCVMQPGIDTGVDMGLFCASVMMKDLTQLYATQWCWWLGASCGDYEDGLVYLNNEDKSISTTYRYSMLAQFTKYISKGDIRISTATCDVFGLSGIESCAFKKADGTIVVVVINSNDRARKLNLPHGMALKEGTFTDANNHLTKLPINKKVILSPKSVTTLVLSTNK